MGVAQQSVGHVGLLSRLARVTTRHRWAVVWVWIALLVGGIALSAIAGGTAVDRLAVPGSDSQKAATLLDQRFPDRSQDTIDIVWRSAEGVDAPAAVNRMRDLLAGAARLPGIVGVASPLEKTGGAISPDGTSAVASLALVGSPDDVPAATSKRLVALVRAASVDGLTVHVAGDPISSVEETQSNAELIGLLAAALILLATFGSVVAAGLPIATALFGLGLGTSLIALLSALIDVPGFAITIAAMIGIGTGIDYALLIVTRLREARSEGASVAAAIEEALTTAGRSVLIAGTTVVISLMGMLVIGLSALQGLALASSLTVLVMMAASITLLPALLAIVGGRIDRLRVPGLGRRPAPELHRTPAWRWSRAVQRRPWVFIALATLILALLAAPIAGLRLGTPDAGNNPRGTQTRAAYELIARAFGPGRNGPLLIVATLARPGDRAAVSGAAGRIAGIPGVAEVSPLQVDAAARTAAFSVVPTTSPQSARTTELVRRLRAVDLPAATARTGARAYVGGATAANIDQNRFIARRVPWFIACVIGLSFLLLLVVFRSPLIAVKAAIMNLASIAAAFGVVALFARGGWAGQLINIDSETPVPAFVPVIMFAILFGLSMDYEVFLLSRIREEYVGGRETHDAVTEGLGRTARVITAAAAIMTVVFLAFVQDFDVFVKLAGLGLATAVLIDATIVRLMLVPAVMQLLGERNWWVPGWLDRLLPRLGAQGRT